ncbi:hypothetical protein K2173_010069 [Erythroxylum novogranatense]|uniref:Integrase catalytic domain-containing protein n=1 Tax=Erythroxylum novogranatense TaxID=1862640 RepID=A0AAV8T140_9ROSI|nr:hypothetical protein K2173_010069 [Erythroxylum novogranatense]
MIEDVTEEAEPEPLEELPEISFHAITGTEHPQTLRLQGHLKGKDVVILVDGGSTHNFMDQSLVHKLDLPVEQDQQFQVMVANKEKITCSGKCSAVTLNIQGFQTQVDFYILPVAACSLVLGVQWLSTLGPIETDYKNLTMTVKQGNLPYTFHGIKGGNLEALTNKEYNGQFCYNKAQQLHPPALQRLLRQYQHIFQTPTQLPPHRTQDHNIPLQPQSRPPTTTKGVRGFLGLAGYYHKFIRGFGSITAPLTKLLTKKGFHWTSECTIAFNELKQAWSSPPVLQLPNFSKTFVVESDASGKGIGAILSQEGRPIAYYSEALKGSMLTLSTYEKEMLAIVKAIRKWRPYLLGRPFVVRTEQRSLKYLLDQRITTPAQARWMPKLMGYDYVVEYRKGKENQGADALSRVVEFHMLTLSIPDSTWWSTLQHEVLTDPFYSRLQEEFLSQKDFAFSKKDGVWSKQGKVFLSPNSSLIPVILQHSHASPLDTLKPAGLLQPLPIPEAIWTDISMDFIEGLPLSHRCSTILVVVDRLSKYSHFIPLRHPFTAATVAKEFICNIVKLHGVPRSIVSDRDKIFLSTFWQHFSSYHPQTDGQTEVVNRTLEQYLLDWLPWAELSFNSSYHSSTKISPFEAVYGTTKVQSVDDYLRQRSDILRNLKLNLHRAQERMTVQANRHRREVQFQVGDWVYLKLQPYRQSSVAFRSSTKLSPRYFGPFQILERVGLVAYRLDLPPGSKIHAVVHVSLLHKHLGDRPTPLAALPPISDDSVILPQPLQILDRRVLKKGKYNPVTEVLVKWAGTIDADATWGIYDIFLRLIQSLSLRTRTL